MIAGERTTAYINSLDMGNTELLNQIEKEALETYVPIIRRETQSFLKTLLAVQKPKVILEVGTAIGFSALLMAEYSPSDTRITTIEKYEKRIPIAKENFRRAGREDQITLLEGDAAEILKGLTGSYDFIFMDAAKGQYIHFLPDVFRLLAPGGILLSQCIAGRRYHRVPLRGGAPGSDHSQPNAGISVYSDSPSGVDHIGVTVGGWCNCKREARK